MIDLRPATLEDLPGILRVWWAADPFDAFNDNPWFRHVLRTGTMVVATLEGRLIGFAGVRRVGTTSVVSDCFVHPEHQSQGIGTSLLSRLLAQPGPVMTLASSDPKARSLYARFGMTEHWDCHYVQGHPAQGGGDETSVSEVDSYPVAEADLSHLRDDLGCRFLEAGTAIAAVGADTVESSFIPSTGDPLEMMSAILDWMAGRGAPKANLHLAEAHPAFPLLMSLGFTVTGVDTLMASEGADVPDPTRITFNGDILPIDP